MNRFRILTLWLVAGGMMLGTACSEEAGSPVPAIQADGMYAYQPTEVSLHIGTSAMQGDAAHTRATEPMLPDLENPIQTLAIFQFVVENQHQRERHFHWLNFLDNDNPTGVLETETDNLKFDFNQGHETTICFVANIDLADVNRFYSESQIEGGGDNRLELEQFEKWTRELEYAPEGTETTGLLTRMPMFGYFKGTLKEGSNSLKIALGRLAARLEVTLEAAEGSDFSGGVTLSMDNVSTIGYYMPGTAGVPEGIKTNCFETVIANESLKNDTTRYFYTAGHSAGSREAATTLNIKFNGETQKVALCESSPEEIASDPDDASYWLNRNTIYRFRIVLKRKGTKATAAKTTRHGEREIVVEF